MAEQSQKIPAEAAPTTSKEVKPSWTTSHIMLTVTLSVLTGIVGYGLKYLFESAPQPVSRILAVRQQVSPNLLGLDERARTGIVANYTLRTAPGRQLVSYFQYRIRVKNVGNVGVEDALIAVENQTEELTLIKSPAMSTEPVNIRAVVSLSKFLGM